MKFSAARLKIAFGQLGSTAGGYGQNLGKVSTCRCIPINANSIRGFIGIWTEMCQSFFPPCNHNWTRNEHKHVTSSHDKMWVLWSKFHSRMELSGTYFGEICKQGLNEKIGNGWGHSGPRQKKTKWSLDSGQYHIFKHVGLMCLPRALNIWYPWYQCY